MHVQGRDLQLMSMTRSCVIFRDDDDDFKVYMKSKIPGLITGPNIDKAPGSNGNRFNIFTITGLYR